MKRSKNNDSRITAPLISWKILLGIIGIMYFVILGQAFILNSYLDQIPTLIGVLIYYLLSTCVLLSVLVGLFWRYVIGKPLRKISQAARQVAGGNFQVQLESGRKNGTKNEIDVLIEDFNTMTRELAGNEMLKNDFISNVSHEIKSPLAVIQSYTKALKDGHGTPEQQAQYMGIILAASQNMNSMISNILKLNKLENQQIFPEAEIYQLGEQLRCCALTFMDQWQVKDIDFEIDVVDIAVRYDSTLLELVWNNLLSNAVKFAEEHGQISLTSWQIEDTVFVRIKDNGCGIDSEAQTKIFEKFYQCDTSHSSDGNGLGLALVKKVVEIVGGRISVESSPGDGAVFTVELSAVTDK